VPASALANRPHCPDVDTQMGACVRAPLAITDGIMQRSLLLALGLSCAALVVSGLALSGQWRAGPAASFDPALMSSAEKAAFGRAVRAHLLENPDVLVETIAVLEERQARAAVAQDKDLIAQNAAAIFDDANSWVGGNPLGDVTVVEFVDYRCSFCRKAHDEVVELIGTDRNIRLVVKEFPILGPESELSSRFAIAVRQLEGDAAYKAAHDKLITFRGAVTAESLTSLAQELGFAPAPILQRMSEASVTDILRANHALAQKLNISGTPTFVIGEEMLRGYVPLEGMRQLVGAARS